MSAAHDPTGTPRYLVPFDLRQIPAYRFDVVVLGSGAAGSVAALAAASGGAAVALVAKASLEESNTRYAQGGVAAVLDAADTLEAHLEDTLSVACGLSEHEVARAVIEGGPSAIERLLSLGAAFDRGPDGHIALSREGGHSHPRVVHAHGDATGREIQAAVSTSVSANERISCFPHTFAVDLLSDRDGRVVGVLCRAERGELVAFLASEVVLATGGAGQLYRETTNPVIATGDGVAMGVRAGAVARDLEFVQFHPTCLYIAGAARVLISEIVRGAGGVLRDRHGERFMPAYHPSAELAPRDVVSRAVFERMVESGDTSVYLDLSELIGDPHGQFPGISRICRFFGIDIASDPIPVRPGAHYMIGGLEVDATGATSVPGLRAVGECASTGLHGANRMGSNSLLEALVLGWTTGEAAARDASHEPLDSRSVLVGGPRPEAPAGVEVNLDDVIYSLKSLMWRQMGVEREAGSLTDALDKLRFWSRAVEHLGPEHPKAWELANMLLVGQLATHSALAREESRGVHHRSDFPVPQDEWCAHSRIVPRPSGENGELFTVALERAPLAADSASTAGAAGAGPGAASRV